MYSQDLDGKWRKIQDCEVNGKTFGIVSSQGNHIAFLRCDIPISRPFKALLFVSSNGYDVGLWKPEFSITDEAYYMRQTNEALANAKLYYNSK